MSKTNWLMKACGIFLLWTAAVTVLTAQIASLPPVPKPTTPLSHDAVDNLKLRSHLIPATDGSVNSGIADTTFKVPRIGKVTSLYSFCAETSCKHNGVFPFEGLIQGLDGDFYGTTYVGENFQLCPNGCGAIYKITSSGAFTTLLVFDATDGERPYAPLALGTDGNFYGSTTLGGALGEGNVFRFSPEDRVITTLHDFCSPRDKDCSDGYSARGSLVLATDGDFYGATISGHSNGAYGGGTAFKITPDGTLTTIYNFCVPSILLCPDGSSPNGLIQASDGNFYGVTQAGGVNACNYDGSDFGCGTIFRLTPGGTLTTLHTFDGTDGTDPIDKLVQGSDGALYGVTVIGGTNPCYVNQGCGTAFKITLSGAFTVLHDFGNLPSASEPSGALIQATDGNFYGTTDDGGKAGEGTLFKMTPTGTFTTVANFGGLEDLPVGALVQGTDGKFYGVTYYGGNGAGSVYVASSGLTPFVRTLPISGTVGSTVSILGTNLTAATRVTFSGVSSGFTVVSGSQITTTVPIGATTGEVQVVTPSGTLSSNVPFTVN